jgi:hypothetical protein
VLTAFKGLLTNKEQATRSSRVVVVRDKNVMDKRMSVNVNVLKRMLDQTVMQVAGKNNTKDAWLTLIKSEDKIGLVADRVYGLGTSKMKEIQIEHLGWEEDLLIDL